MEFVDDFEQDSGMESSPYSKDNSSKDVTPERKPDDIAFEMEGSSITEKKPEEAVDVVIVTAATPPEASTPPAAQGSPTTSNAGTVAKIQPNEDDDNYDDEPDETLGERLWGLTEMFPDCVVNTTHTVTTNTWSGIKMLYSFTRSATWIIASTSVILFAPVLFELERAKTEEMQKSQQKQFLLGPSAAMVGSGGPPPPPIPR